MPSPEPALHIALENARNGAGIAISGARLVASAALAQREGTHGARRVDLKGDRLLPGLINAHDHLPLNSLAPLARGRLYRNAREWIADVAEWRRRPALSTGPRHPRDQRLLAGALKNLLSGVTTVAHHDPLYPELLRPGFPLGLLEHYGWSHSLHIDGPTAVEAACRETPPERPWIIHAAEGIDAEAHAEFTALERLGCITPTTLLVHGVGLDCAQRTRLLAAGAGLIWCPSSNLRLFGRTAEVAELLSARRLGIGSDSRLSGARDLLVELSVAQACLPSLDEDALIRLASCDNAALLRLEDRGALRAGARADVLILPRAVPLGSAQRADVRMVMVAGRMLYGDRDYAQAIAPEAQWTSIRVDGREKVLDGALARELRARGVEEPGLLWPSDRMAA